MTTVFPKVQTFQNQVFVNTGLNKNDTSKLTSLVVGDNANGCDECFWSKPIDNGDETKSLLEMTPSKTKAKYVLEPLNRVNLCYDNAAQSGTKDVSSETSSEQHETTVRKEKPKSNIHKSTEELIAKKR